MLNGRYETVDSLMNEKQWIKWSLWLKGDKTATSTEFMYLNDLQNGLLKAMNKDEFSRLFQSDSLTAVPILPEVRMTI